MAGGEDYIPIRTALVDDPDVRWIAQKLKKDPDLIVGKLVRFWSWAARVTANGRLAPYTAKDVDRLVSLKGFSEALKTFRPGAGWLAEENGELVIPKWDEWMSDSAKARAGEAVRGRLRRQDERPDARPDRHPDKRRDQAEQSRAEESRAEQSSKGQKDIAEEKGRAGAHPENGIEHPAPLLRSDAQKGLCPLLLAMLPGVKPTEAAAIAQEPRATREKVLWALDRLREQRNRAEAGTGRRIENEVGWVRALIQGEEGPTAAWRKRSLRRILAIDGAKEAVAEMAGGSHG